MREHLKFLLPNIQAANQASEALLLARIDNKNISFMARPGLALGKLQAASMVESSNMINGGARGILFGATIGLILGLYTHYFQPWVTEPMHINWIVLVGAIMVLGAALSAIGAALLGSNRINDDLVKYKKRIDEGAILMIVAAPYQRSDEITKVVSKLHLKY